MSANNWNNQHYAPAEFDSYEVNQPVGAAFDISGSGNDAAYTTATNNIIAANIDGMNSTTMVPKNIDWKKRLREFLSKKNTELLDFLNLSVVSHPTLGKGDALLWKFNNRNLLPHAGLVKKVVMDISGADIFSEIKAAVLEFRTEDSIADLKTTVQYIYDEYRKAGDTILKAQTTLKIKLDTFDKIQKNIISLLELEPTCTTDGLMKETENYLADIFEKHKIQSAYEELIGAYRRFVVLREFVQMFRLVQSNENEPLCPICLDNVVSYCINPCGHTLCEKCMKRQTVNCFMCRTQISNTIKLYFG